MTRGRKPDAARAAMRVKCSKMSERTFQTYWNAHQYLNAQHPEMYPYLYSQALRANGSLNVSLFERLVNAACENKDLHPPRRGRGPGHQPDPRRAALRSKLPLLSERSFADVWAAFKRLEAAGASSAACRRLLKDAESVNGRLKVRQFVREAEVFITALDNPPIRMEQ